MPVAQINAHTIVSCNKDALLHMNLRIQGAGSATIDVQP